MRNLTTIFTMNLLARNASLRKFFKPGLMFLIPVFFACETSNDLGVRYQLDSEANVNFIEFTLPATNIYLDSLRTDGENIILVGSYADPLTGSVTAEGYLQFFYEAGPMPRGEMFFEDSVTTNQDTVQVLRIPQDTIKVDSILITFEANSIVPSSGTSFQEFGLYELQDSLESSVVYLSNLQQTTTTEIGSFSQSINTTSDDIFQIKLTESFSQGFFDQLSSIALDTNQNVRNTNFQSLGLVPGGLSESITSFDLRTDTSRMVIYSSPVDTEAKDTTYLTSFIFTGKNYTHLRRDRTGSGFDGIGNNQDTTASNRNLSLPSGQAVIDPLAGISTAFSLDELITFVNENPRILINSATMSFEFEVDNQRDTLVNFINQFRRPQDVIFGPAILSDPFGNIIMTDNAYSSLRPGPSNGVLNENKDQILINATLFYQQLYRESQDGNSLFFQHPTAGNIIPIDELVLLNTRDVVSPDVTLRRTIIKENGIKLSIYYTETN